MSRILTDTQAIDALTAIAEGKTMTVHGRLAVAQLASIVAADEPRRRRDRELSNSLRQRDRLTAPPERVEVVSPALHHVAPLGQVLGMVEAAATSLRSPWASCRSITAWG